MIFHKIFFNHFTKLFSFLGITLMVFFLFSPSVSAQSPDSLANASVTDTAAVSATDTASSGPSLTNLTKVLTETAPQVKKEIEEEERMKTIWLIVEGTIGTILLIVIAWLLTNYARKIQKRRDEEKSKVMEKIMKDRAAKGITKSRRR